ncbi:hypothetical protein [Paenibacillus sp. FSL K6-1230]|uniref:hypothetical protein n=1 Tax=Paenibacillus sp. FSL K6-1230 TaxID=2921603 RepID=UPI0030FA6571
MSEEASKPPVLNKESSELKKLITEKINLAKKLGIMGNLEPIQGYSDTEEYKRIEEIDKRLWELVK